MTGKLATAYALVLSLLLIICGATAAKAALQTSGAVRWLASVADADYVPSLAGTYRIFDTPAQLTLLFTFTNETSDPIVVTQSTLRQDVTFAVTSDVEIPIIADWQSEFSKLGIRTPVLPDTEIQIEPGEGVGWTVALSRADGLPFAAVRYAIRISVAMSHARNPGGQPWVGRVALPASMRYVVIGGPSTSPQERSAAHRQTGKKALQQGRLNDALTAFQAAVAADPTNPVALIALGDTYIRLRRFREAVSPLEQALAVIPLERSGVPRQLALAYLGINDEANATRVLRNAGVTADRIPEEVERLRKRLGR